MLEPQARGLLAIFREGGSIWFSGKLSIRASNGSFGLLVILLGGHRRRLPVGPFSDDTVAVLCFHFWVH